MNLLRLRDFARSAWDPRLIVLDLRDDPSPALDNRLVTWVRSQMPRNAREMNALTGLLRGRHVVVVHDNEATALRFCSTLEQGKVEVSALEGGYKGWQRTLLAERIDEYAEARVSRLYAPAGDRHAYVAAAGGIAVVVDPAGTAAVIADEAKRLSAVVAAAVDTVEPLDDASHTIALELAVPHFFPRRRDFGGPALPAIPMRFGAFVIVEEGNRLTVRGSGFEIGHAGLSTAGQRVGTT